MDELLARSAEEELSQIAGVVSVAIDHRDGAIEAIHVLADESRRPKQIVRDVVTSLRTIYDLVLDHKKISVVCRPQVRPSTDHPVTPSRHAAERGRESRVEIRSLTLTDRGDECEAEVVLSAGGREVLGSAGGGAAAATGGRLLAEATSRALERLLDARYRVGIGEVEHIRSPNDRGIVLVTVVLGDGRNERRLLGCAWADEGLRRAAVYATLDATNRILGRLRKRKHIDYDVGPASPSDEGSEAD